MLELLRRLVWLFRRRRLERELAEELAFHREQMSAERRPSFGEELRLREDAREVWGWGWLDRLAIDLRYGARVLRRSPGFTLTATLVLTLGIGVPLAAFRVVASELGGGAVPDLDSLVRLTHRSAGHHRTSLSYPELAFYAEHARSFRSVFGISRRHPAELEEGVSTEPIHLTFVTADAWDELGITPRLGRLLSRRDERPGAEPAVLLGEPFWRRRYAGDPAVIGRTIRVDGVALRVVGVIPRTPEARDEVFVPYARRPELAAGSSLASDWTPRLELYGRLRPGISPAASESETRLLAARLRQLRPREESDRGPSVGGEYLEARPIDELAREDGQGRMLATAAGLVLLLLVAAAANLGILVLARGVGREGEIRVRLALGAGRGRIVRQLFTESILLATLASLAALAFSTLVLLGLRGRFDSAVELAPDPTAFAATFGAALVVALAFGLPTALRLSRLVPGAGRARTVFLGAQVAASCLLLVVSSLLVRTIERLADADPGFDHRQLLAISPGLDAHGYGAAAAGAYLETLRERAAALPGVALASRAWIAPWSNLHYDAHVGERRLAGNLVDARFLETLGIPVLRGRGLEPGDRDAALVNEAAARTLWPGEEALGKTLPWQPAGQVVVGVVADASTARVGLPAALEFYRPLAGEGGADWASSSVVVVRAEGNPRELVQGLERLARDLDGRLRPRVEVVTDAYEREVQGVATALAVIATLGTGALLLSIVGLAGLAGYTVAQRTREIGLRMALGARAGHVVAAILAPLGRPIGVGFLLGALGGSAAAVVLRGVVPAMAGLEVLDPLPYAMALAAFAAAVALAVLVPGRRALRIDPARALQHE